MSPIKKLRTGYTTGACAAAAAKAAARLLIKGKIQNKIKSILPNGQEVDFALSRTEINNKRAICSVIKGDNDDPDCTVGAELTAEVTLNKSGQIKIMGDSGVARVTKKGLGLELNEPAITAVPRKNISEMVLAELKNSEFTGAKVVISVPGGEEMAKKTINERLGLVGGISILGISGIVKPYSTSAYRTYVQQAVEVAKIDGNRELVFTTGGRTEKYAMKFFPKLSSTAFIQVADFIGAGLKKADKEKIEGIKLVGMIGKLSKIADGKMMSHASGSKVNLNLLSKLAQEAGSSPELVVDIKKANTAREVLELCGEYQDYALINKICNKAAAECGHLLTDQTRISVYLVDYKGNLLGFKGDKIE